MSNVPRDTQSEVRAFLREGKKIDEFIDERTFKYRFIDGDGLLLTIKRITTRAGTSMRFVHDVGIEFKPDIPPNTHVSLHEWAVAGYCRLGAQKMQFDSREFIGSAILSPKNTHTDVTIDAEFINPRIDMISRGFYIVKFDLSIPPAGIFGPIAPESP